MRTTYRRILYIAICVGMLLSGSYMSGKYSVGLVQAQTNRSSVRGGASAEMLAFALNMHGAASYQVVARNTARTAQRNIPDSAGSDAPLQKDVADTIRAIGQLPCESLDSGSLTGKSFAAGVYCTASVQLNGSVTLDAAGDPNAIFVLRSSGRVNIGSDSSFELIGGARAENVFIVSNENISIGDRTNAAANFLADSDITVGEGSIIRGRAASASGSISARDDQVTAATGYIEVCKEIIQGDAIIAGTLFTFNVAGTDYLAPAGGCTAPILVTAGNVTIVEGVRANTAVVAVAAEPSDRLVTSNLGTRTAVVAVPAGDAADQTVVTFTNQTAKTGTLEICKYGLDDDVTGFFNYTVQGVLPTATSSGIISVPVGFCSGVITTTVLQTPAAPLTANVTELVRASFRLEAVDTLPLNKLAGPFVPNQGFDPNGVPIANNANGGYATVLLNEGGPSLQVLVNFRNRSLPGRVKVCKITADPVGIPVGTLFRFTINGLQATSSTQTMPGVSTSVAFDVPAGPASQNGFCVFAPGRWIGGLPVRIDETGISPNNTTIVGPGQLRASRIRSITSPVTINLTPTAGTTQTFQAAGPIAIDPSATVAVPINAAGSGVITDINAAVRIDHPTDGSLSMRLEDPNGTGVDLSQNRGGNGANFGTGPNDCSGVGTGFDDQAVNPISAGIAPFSDTFRPEQPLSAFNARSFNGQWTMRIANQAGSGTFGCAKIQVTTSGVVASAVITTRNATSEAEFTNYLYRPAILKLCKAGGPGVSGTATFTLSLPDPLTSLPVSSAPINVPVGYCTPVNGPFAADPAFPGWGTFNLNTQLTITEAASTSSVLTAVTSPTGNPVVQDLNARSGTITLTNSSTFGYWNEIRFLNSAPSVPRARFDFDGDGRSDMTIYRSGTWLYAASGSDMAVTPIQLGSASDKLVAADYDGDGKADAAVYSNGSWSILGSTAGPIKVNFGLATDIPEPADYDGDGKADIAVYRPSNGTWYMQLSQGGFRAIQFGIATDLPVAADFDGDGMAEPAVYRNGTWYVLGSNSGFYGVQFGIAGDVPVQADYDGDGKADMAVYRGGMWHILGSTTGYKGVQFGLATDIPVPADYDGDGKTDVVVYRPSTSVWHLLPSGSQSNVGGGYTSTQFGAIGDVLLNY